MSVPTVSPSSYFEAVGGHRYKPTPRAGGAWAPDEQHFSPLSGLVVHALDRYRAAGRDDGLLLSRISYDILGRLALDECEIEVETVRPGRTIELLEAVVRISGRAVLRARAWYLTALDTSAVAGGPDDRLAPPDSLAPWPAGELWPGGYIDSVEIRPVVPRRPGRTAAWVSSPVELVAGVPVSPLAAFLTLVDTANGIAVRQSPAEWMFPNVDLTIHLHRQPRAGWTGLDTKVTFGPTGQGLTSTVLHDVDGPVGHATQILTVRPLPGD
ncbi:thioesterase family protein [Streptomyces sp. NPDC001068]|uniref:thioesterase family protein n=1 Tax=Streptomyces sp. NPDC001068 TaxID=3364544 RepID=UPI0036902E60